MEYYFIPPIVSIIQSYYTRYGHEDICNDVSYVSVNFTTSDIRTIQGETFVFKHVRYAFEVMKRINHSVSSNRTIDIDRFIGSFAEFPLVMIKQLIKDFIKKQPKNRKQHYLNVLLSEAAKVSTYETMYYLANEGATKWGHAAKQMCVSIYRVGEEKDYEKKLKFLLMGSDTVCCHYHLKYFNKLID